MEIYTCDWDFPPHLNIDHQLNGNINFMLKRQEEWWKQSFPEFTLKETSVVCHQQKTRRRTREYIKDILQCRVFKRNDPFTTAPPSGQTVSLQHDQQHSATKRKTEFLPRWNLIPVLGILKRCFDLNEICNSGSDVQVFCFFLVYSQDWIGWICLPSSLTDIHEEEAAFLPRTYWIWNRE